MKNFNIVTGYKHRTETKYWDDTHLRDEWQREVYLMAAAIMATNGHETVLDVGCGSGFKLMHYLGSYKTTGIEIEPTLAFLKSTYPDNRWLPVGSEVKADLVICADVIEHVLDPDELCYFIKKVAKKHIIISTPDRDLYNHPIGLGLIYGPPLNECHVREWTFAEFGDYMKFHFDVLGHVVSNWGQTTQAVICQVKS